MRQADSFAPHFLIGLGIALVITTLMVLLTFRMGWTRKGIILYTAGLLVLLTATGSAVSHTVSSASWADAETQQISEEYGYIFTSSDETKMRGIFPSDVVLNPETADGTIRQVLIRYNGEERIPYVMGEDDEWVRAQPLQDAGGSHVGPERTPPGP